MGDFKVNKLRWDWAKVIPELMPKPIIPLDISDVGIASSKERSMYEELKAFINTQKANIEAMINELTSQKYFDSTRVADYQGQLEAYNAVMEWIEDNDIPGYVPEAKIIFKPRKTADEDYKDLFGKVGGE